MTENIFSTEHYTRIGLLGAGPQAREICDYCEELDIKIDFFAVNTQYIADSSLPVIDILRASVDQTQLAVIVGVGAPAVKRLLVDQWPGKKYATITAKSSWISKHADLGGGVVISPKCTIARESLIGLHAFVNIGATVSHDVVLGDFCTVAPGVNIGGRAKIGAGVFLGLNATIRNDVAIANGIVVGAGALVVSDLDVENGVYVGCPAKLHRVNDGWPVEVV